MHKSFYGLCALVCANIFAATPIDLRQQSISTLKVLSSSTSQNTPQFTEMQSTTDFNQTRHIRLQEMYSGYPVWGGDIVLHIPNGNEKTFNDVMAAHSTTGITMNGVMYQDLYQDLRVKPADTFSNTQMNNAIQQVILHDQKKYFPWSAYHTQKISAYYLY